MLFFMLRLFHIFGLVWSIFLYIHYFCLDLVGVFKLGQTDFRFIVRLTWVYFFGLLLLLWDWSRLH